MTGRPEIRLAMILLVCCVAMIDHLASAIFNPARAWAAGARTVEQVIRALGPAYHDDISKKFAAAGCAFPGAPVTFIILKRERTLEAWCKTGKDQWRLVDDYFILAASGKAGPKLKQGDMQVPEGIYTISAMNPNSRFNLSMKLDYPNRFDRDMARADGRENLGGDIFIHGSFFSIGCLAMGDWTIEELFYMTQKTGRAKVSVVIMPYDFRRKSPVLPPGAPSWTDKLYKALKERAAVFKVGS